MKVSATQIKAFQRCRRAWWHQWVNGEKPAPSKGMILGSEYHAQLEDYLKRGNLPEHPLPRLGVDHLPAPGTEHVYAEHRFTIPSRVEGVRVTGVIDVLDLSGTWAHVIDHKFLADLKYAKKGEQLAQDTQMLLYGRVGLGLHGHASEVELVHLSYRRTGRALVERSSTRVCAGELDAWWDTVNAVDIPAMRVASDAPTAGDVEGHASAPDHPACRAYGGCPHRQTCAVYEGGHARLFAGVAPPPPTKEASMPTAEKKLRGLWPQLDPHDQDLLLKGASAHDFNALLKSPYLAQAVEAAANWGEAPAPSELLVWYDLADRVLGEDALPDIPRENWSIHPLLRSKHEDAIRSALEAKAGVRLEDASTAKAFFENQALDEQLKAEGIADPDAMVESIRARVDEALSPKAEDTFELPTEAELAAHTGVIVPHDAPPNAVPVPPDPAEEPVTSVEGVGEVLAERLSSAMGWDPPGIPTLAAAAAWIERQGPKKAAGQVRGLSPAKAEAILEAAGLVAVEVEVEVVEKASEEAPAPEAPAAAPAPRAPQGYTLLVDCLVAGADSELRDVLRLEELLVPLQLQVEAANNVSHYNLMEYGKGPHAVAALLRASLGAIPQGAIIVADSRQPCSPAAIEVLSQRAAMVVRGLR